MNKLKINIGLLGLGYVGLPLLLTLSKKYKVVGFDTDKKRVNQIKKGSLLLKLINRSIRLVWFSYT